MKFDVAIIGGGPAGLTSCIYTSRAGLSTICFEKLVVGGQASLAYCVENFPGVPKVNGYELVQKMFEQAKDSGTHFVFGEAIKISKSKQGFSIETKAEKYMAKKLIISCGTISRKLGLNEDMLVGKGISYCASCDGYFFKNKKVAVVGGGDSAFSYVEYLSRLASEVYLIHRNDKFKASSLRIKTVEKLKNVKILKNCEVEKLIGDETLSKIKLSNGEELFVDGLFVAIGHVPKLDFLNFEIEKDDNGYILVNDKMQTSEKNVFACGDILSKHFKQIITACSDGAVAGNSCIEG